jgi:hypothetical protein
MNREIQEQADRQFESTFNELEKKLMGGVEDEEAEAGKRLRSQYGIDRTKEKSFVSQMLAEAIRRSREKLKADAVLLAGNPSEFYIKAERVIQEEMFAVHREVYRGNLKFANSSGTSAGEIIKLAYPTVEDMEAHLAKCAQEFDLMFGGTPEKAFLSALSSKEYEKAERILEGMRAIGQTAPHQIMNWSATLACRTGNVARFLAEYKVMRDAKEGDLQIHREGLEQMLGELIYNASPVSMLVASQEQLAQPQTQQIQEIFARQIQRKLVEYLDSLKEVPNTEKFMEGVRDVAENVAYEVSRFYPVRVHIEPVFGKPRKEAKKDEHI